MRKATISFIIFVVCTSVRMEQLGSHWKDFQEIWRLWIFFENMARKFKFYYNLTRIIGTLHEGQYIFLIISYLFLLRMRNSSDKNCRENQNTHFMFNNFLRKSCHLWENVEKYCTAGQATIRNVAHAHCKLDTYGYRHVLTICNTYCFSSATMVTLEYTAYIFFSPRLPDPLLTLTQSHVQSVPNIVAWNKATGSWRWLLTYS